MSQIAARVMQAEALLAQGKGEEALALAQRLLPKSPGDPGLNSLMASILLRLGRYEQAEFYARRAQAAEPASAGLMVNLAIALKANKKEGESLAVLRRAVEVSPADAPARLALANALLDIHDAPAAAEQLRLGLALKDDAQMSVSYSGALLTMGYVEESVEFTRRALAKFPHEAYLAGGLPMSMTYLYGADPDEVAEAHRAYGRLMARLRPGIRHRHTNPCDPDRTLRVGLVSPDFRQHSVSFFIEPFFEHHDRAAFELVGYSASRDPDRVTERLRSYASAWREIPNLTDIQTAQRVHEDRIDVLIDLAGHTLGNRLPTFALRPAPVQVTYCGYPDTTGLPEIDWRIVDSLTDPAWSKAQARASETLWRLDPCFLCYRPLREAPRPVRDPGWPGPVFGSFNASRKINRGVIAAWAKILHRVPGSSMILKSFDFAAKGAMERIREEFAKHGVGEGRLTFMSATKSLTDHLALYSRMDVALDAFPYNGTTTTCEALWMGVPVVALRGESHAGRVGVSLLTNAGVSELIAADEEQYVSLAAALAEDAPRLAAYRAELRSAIAGSAICDTQGFSRRFEGALRAMWKAWCARGG